MEMINDTIGGMLETIAERYPERDALIHREKGTRYTYQLLSWQVDQVVFGLAGLGVKRGDHVAIWPYGHMIAPFDPQARQTENHLIHLP